MKAIFTILVCAAVVFAVVGLSGRHSSGHSNAWNQGYNEAFVFAGCTQEADNLMAAGSMSIDEANDFIAGCKARP